MPPAPPVTALPALSAARLLLYLSLPPLLWAGNAVVGRLLVDSSPPLLLNALRWLLALLCLLPFTTPALRQGRHALPLLRRHWRWWALTGLLGMSAYNALQYQALHTTTPLNATLITASMPLTMMLVGWLALGVRPNRHQGWGALLSLLGVMTVVGQGEWQRLQGLHWAVGDALMLLASLSWAGYSWALTRRPTGLAHWGWADILVGQTLFGLLVAGSLALAEQSWTATALHTDIALLAGLAYVAMGPSLLAYRYWGLGVARVGPAKASFFVNLTPLFAALLTLLVLGEAPRPFHALAFALIAAGIALSSRPTPAPDR